MGSSHRCQAGVRNRPVSSSVAVRIRHSMRHEMVKYCQSQRADWEKPGAHANGYGTDLVPKTNSFQNEFVTESTDTYTSDRDSSCVVACDSAARPNRPIDVLRRRDRST